jgi:DNA-binding response OmpR family regulator
MNVMRKMNQYLGSNFVLVIEPSQSYRTTLKNFFQNIRVKNLKIMASVEEARREMITVKAGMFLVERNLPGKSGLQFCRELRRASAHETTPFLLLGTESFRHDIILASEGGVDSYLLKPFSFEDFLGQINLIISSSQNPSSLKRILERADTHLRNGETWIAESLFLEAQNIKSNSARAMCGLGLVAMESRDFKAAKEKLQLAISFNPDYLETYQHLLKLAKDSHDQSCLLDTAKLLHEMSPENPRYPLIMAELLLQLDDIEAAQKFQKLAEKKSMLLKSNKADIHPAKVSKNPAGKVQKTFVSALDLDSDDAGLLTSLGLGYVTKNMLVQAIKTFQFALRLNPTDSEVLYNLAMAYELSGDATSATHSLRLALAANPLFGKAKIKLQELGASAAKELTKNVVDNASDHPPLTEIEKKGA